MRALAILGAAALLAACSGTNNVTIGGGPGGPRTDGGSGSGSGSSSGSASGSGSGSGSSSGSASGSSSGSSSGVEDSGVVDVVSEPAPPPVCPPPPFDGGTACNALSPMGATVSLQCSQNQMPTPSGGTIADGFYTLTAATYYGATCNPEQDRNTWLVCGSTWQTTQESSTGGTNSYDLNVTNQGTGQLAMQIACQDGMTGASQTLYVDYDASGSTLTLYFNDGNGAGRVDVYARQ